MKKGIALLLATLLSLTFISPSFAAVATPSVASVSNALPMEEYFETDDFDTLPLISPLALGDSTTITNTVDYSQIWCEFSYYDMSNNFKWSTGTVDSDGTFHFFRPDDFARMGNILDFVLRPGAIPPSGKYNLDFSLNFDVGGHAITDVQLVTDKGYNNANTLQNRDSVSFSDIGGDVVAETSIDINNGLSQLYFAVYISNFNVPNSGLVKFEFDRLSSSAPVDNTSAGADTSDAASDTAQNTEDIANNTAQIADNQVEIMDTIREQVQYITLQLEAFWNQLAGEFTNLFNKMTDQLNQLMGGIDNQTEELKDSLSDVESEIDNSATEINNTINQSTNTITNGWDSSGLQQSGNELNDSLTQYDDVESGIHDTASDWLGDYTLPNFDQLLGAPGVIAACTWLGTFMQTVFVNMGSFNVPVTLSLVLIFVLILVGYYRIRR